MSDSAVLTLVNSSRRQNNGSEGQFHHLELDAGCNMKQLEVPEEGGHLKTRRAAARWIHCCGFVAEAGSPAKNEL